MPSFPVEAVSTSYPSRSSRVCNDSRISASSSMIKTVPMGDAAASLGLRRVMTAASDIDRFPHQGKIKVELGTFAWLAFHADFSRVFLNDAVRHRKTQPGALTLALAGGDLR